MAIRRENLDNRGVSSRIDNSSRLVFRWLCDIPQEQSDFRAMNYGGEVSKEGDIG